MTTSENINEIAAALAKAQAVMVTASKDSTNPHFRSKYADLESVRDACRPLADHGIAIIQGCRSERVEGGVWAVVDTRLVHVSGQWIGEELAVPVSKPDAQGLASAMTYGRRIGLAGISGLAPADDDGEAAVGRPIDPITRPVAFSGVLTVTDAVSKKTTGGKTQWAVTFSDGLTATTITERIGLLAEQFKMSGVEVEREYEKKGPYTNLLALSSVHRVDKAPDIAPNASEIPF